MIDAPWAGCQDAWFYLMVAADFLLIVSLVFSAFYSLFLLSARCFPRFLSTHHPSAVLLLCASAFAISFSAVGDATAALANGVTNALVFSRGESLLPDVPIILWGAGTAVSCLFLTREFAKISRLTKSCATIAACQAFIRASEELGIRKTVLLKNSGPDGFVSSWGLFAACVFVPDTFASTYSDEEQYYIFLHELGHIRRMDTVKYLCARLVRAVFWFHPMARLCIRNIHEAIEIACDRETTARKDVHSLCYARLIVKAYANAAVSMPEFSGGYGDVKRRLGHITGDTRWAAGTLRRLLPPVAFLLAVAGVALFFADPAGHPVREERPAATVVDGPDGRKVELVTRFWWNGALGCYSAIEANPVSDAP